MAASDAIPVPRKNVAFRMYFAVRDTSGSLVTSWTGQDSEVSKDGGSFADCTNEATEIGTSGVGYIDLTSTEMNADSVVYKLTVTNSNAISVVVTLYPESVGDYRIDDSALATASSLATVAGYLDTEIAAILEDTGTTIPAQIAALNNLSSAQVVSALGTGTWATAIPWNASWNAEVQSECNDALVAYGSFKGGDNLTFSRSGKTDVTFLVTRS